MEIDMKQLEEILEQAKEEAKRAVVTEAVKSLSWEVKHKLASVIGEAVTEFIREEILPDVRAYLLASKGPIMEAVISVANDIGREFAAGLAEKAKERLSKSYTRDKLMRELFS